MIQELLSKNFIGSVKAATTFNSLNDVHVLNGGDNKLAINLDTISVEVAYLQGALLYLGEAAAILYFLYGAVSYIISYGNEAKATKAKQTMLWAIIGVVVIALAQLMVNLVKSYTK